MRPTGNWRPALLDLETDLVLDFPLPPFLVVDAASEAIAPFLFELEFAETVRRLSCEI